MSRTFRLANPAGNRSFPESCKRPDRPEDPDRGIIVEEKERTS